MRASVQRYLSAGILTIWGVMLAHFYFSGRLASYLHPSFHVWTGISGVVLLLLATGMLFLPRVDDPCSEPGCEQLHAAKASPQRSCSIRPRGSHFGGRDGLSDQFGETIVTNPAFIERINDLPGYKPYVEPPLPASDDSQAAAGTGDADASYLPKNEAGQIKAQTVDLLYAAEEPTMRADFENKEVELIGQFMPARANNAKGDRFNLVRMFVMCCAATHVRSRSPFRQARPSPQPK